MNNEELLSVQEIVKDFRESILYIEKLHKIIKDLEYKLEAAGIAYEPYNHVLERIQ